MVNEPKRIEVTSTTANVNSSVSARFGPGTGTIIRRLTNYHNIWWSFAVEPTTADANANGHWVLWLKSDTNNPDPSFTDTDLNSGDFNMLVIACGVWQATNQTPFNSGPQHMSSSRNLVANQELVLTVRQEGLTTGVSQFNLMLCAGLSVK